MVSGQGLVMSEGKDEQPIRDYHDLLVWQKGMVLAKMIYVLTQQFPLEEKFGLVSQLRRTAVSVPSNIAEGQARRTTGEFIQSLSYAEGSLAELDAQLLLSCDFGFTAVGKIKSSLALIVELRKMLNSLRRKLE